MIRLQAGRWPGWSLFLYFILMLTVAWSLYDEFYGLRPWRSYQAEFSRSIPIISTSNTSSAGPPSRNFTRRREYQKLMADVKAATDAARSQDQQIGEQIDLLDRQRAAMTDAFQTSRGLVGSLTYQLEQIDEKDKSAKESKLKELNDAKARDLRRRVARRGRQDRAAEIQLRPAERPVHFDHDRRRRSWSPSAATSTSPPRTRRTS